MQRKKAAAVPRSAVRAAKVAPASSRARAVRQPAQPLSRIIHQTHDAVFTLDLKGRITSWNTGAQRLFGYRPAEVLGKHVRLLYRRQDRAVFQSVTLPQLLQKGWLEFETPARRKSGEEFDRLVSMSLLRDETQRPVGIASYTIEITARKKAEAELVARARQQTALVELGQRALSGTALSMLIDEAVKMVASTLAVEYSAVLELSPDHKTLVLRAGVGWKPRLVRSGRFQDVRAAPATRAARSEKPIIVEDLRTDARFNVPFLLMHNVVSGVSVGIRGQHHPFWVLSAYTTKRRKFGESEVGFLQAISNVLAQAISREQLERQHTETAKLAATARMAASIAHEINNPIAGIKHAFLLVQEAVPETHPYHVYVLKIQKEIDRIALIVRQMFKLYQQPESQRRHTCHIREAIADVVMLLESAMRQHEVTIEQTLCDASAAVPVPQEGQIRQVLYNVVQNAIEASPPRGVIRIGTALADQLATITITDQGSGIAAELRARLFEPFFTTKSTGMGLGLAISKNLVEGAGGSLELASEPGSGTVCRIVLPFERVGSSDHPA